MADEIAVERALSEMAGYDLGLIHDITSDCECESLGCPHIYTVTAVGDRGDQSVGIPPVFESPWFKSDAGALEWWEANKAEVMARLDAEFN